jgi:hypothetical protein
MSDGSLHAAPRRPAIKRLDEECMSERVRTKRITINSRRQLVKIWADHSTEAGTL